MKAVFSERQTTNIVLTGFMGVGKSAIAKILATSLQIHTIDSDKIIEQTCQKSIVEIFRQSEVSFREQETKFLQENLQKEKTIFSLGGGIVEKAVNRKLLKQLGIIFFLKAPFDDLWDRIKDCKHRPKIIDNTSKQRIVLQRLYQKRIPHYQEIADFTISTVAKITSSTQEIERIYHYINGKNNYCQTK